MKVSDLNGLVLDTKELFRGVEGIHVHGYGHLGDGNLHLCVVARHGTGGSSSDDGSGSGVNICTLSHEDILAALEPWVYEWVSHRGGSISAEHGLGQMKNEKIGYSKSPAAVGLMHRIKDVVDPRGIMNPYKVLPGRKEA